MKTLINDGLSFVCHTEQELWRARTLLTKEPGTIAWLNEQLHEGDVFYDIGANVGCYTLYAARLVGATGHVYAFEPHPANAAALLRNISVNNYVDRVTVITTPLADRLGVMRLALGSIEPATSGTSFGTSGVLAVVTSVDALVAEDDLPLPDVVKVDVDGAEPLIVIGMHQTLRSRGTSPRSLQIESAPEHRDNILALLRQHGYDVVKTHYTKQCQESIDRGVPPSIVIENSVFQRAA